MTPTTLARKAAHTMWTTRRGVGILVGLLMVIIGLLLYAIITSGPAQVVEYGSTVIAPDQGAYCPGETMTYPVTVSVFEHDLPVTLEVNEVWWRERDGLTLQSTARVYKLPLLRPVNVQATARRTVPDLEPGVYWFDHISENGRTEAYTVGPVTIKECSP
jgi:hypothetical protein